MEEDTTDSHETHVQSVERSILCLKSVNHVCK